MQTKDLTQEIIFSGTPKQVYDLYVDEDLHADITGAEAEIEPTPCGNFSAYDGYAMGEIIALEEGKRIEHTWRAEEDAWPDDHFSNITIELSAHPEGCLMKFSQTGIPQEVYHSIAQGWFDYYWEPMKDHLVNS